MAKTFKMVDGDIYFDVNGRLVEITGFEKVSQDIAESLLTDLDVDRDFGSELNAVSTNPTLNIGRQQVSSFVRDSIDRLRKLQRTNTTTTRDEEIVSIDAIEVYKNDQTEITFGLAVSTSNGNSSESAVSLKAKATKLNHLLAPSITEENQRVTNELLGRKAVTTGETK